MGAQVCPSCHWSGSAQRVASVPAHVLTPSLPQNSRAERPLVVLAQLTLNCFASFLLFSFVVFLFCSCLFVLLLGLGLRVG